MSQLPEIPAFAYTSEMNTLGAILDILVFEGDWVPVSRNALTLGTRPLQLLLLPGTEFLIRCETSAMHDFQTEVDLGKARAGGSSTDASAFWDLLDPPIRSRVVAAGFGDYVAGLRCTQPRFQPAMRYALMERWNDCTYTFIFGFGEMTLTPVDYTAITGLRFDGPVAPLDGRYQTAALGAELVRTLARPLRLAQSFLFYVISSQLLCTSQNKGDPAVLACLRDLGRVGSYSWASLALAHLYHCLDVWTRGSGESNWQFLRPLKVWAYEYRIYPCGPGGDASADTWRIPWYLVHCHHTFSSFEDPHYWSCYLNDRALSDEAYPAHAVAEAYTQSRFLLRGFWFDRLFLGERIYELQVATTQRRVPNAPSHHMCLLEGMTPEDLSEEYIGSPADTPLSVGDYATYFSTRLQARLPEVREYNQDLEIGRLRRHQSRQSSAVTRLQMEVDRLRTRLEVEGIPLDFSEDEEDGDDGSSSDDALPLPPSQAAAGPSRRRR
ncbi:hypothetical protein JCGZ_08259 [Jatropha curcas]|uniref:Aminotransferase-like plant mobile domain-containing protein n=1 Tax=Jatropha curcas TaxID=180498 RepID=A0A067KRC9_JATCU|nr:hypothetical protein JCGZ_08259 [Jatropha curcas]